MYQAARCGGLWLTPTLYKRHTAWQSHTQLGHACRRMCWHALLLDVSSARGLPIGQIGGLLVYSHPYVMSVVEEAEVDRVDTAPLLLSLPRHFASTGALELREDAQEHAPRRTP